MLLPTALLVAAEILPALTGEYLTGRKAALPDDARGKVALLAFGFSYDSRFAVEDWVKNFRREFAAAPAVTFYEIPMVGGMARLGRFFIDRGMRKGTPAADHERVITVYGGVEPWKKRLGVTDTDFAYLVLLDAEGAIRWRHSGKWNEQYFAELAAEVRGIIAARK